MMTTGKQLSALVALVGSMFFAPLVAPVCAGEAALPARPGLAVAVAGVQVKSADEIVLLCELRNLSGATLRCNAPEPVTEEKSSTTVSADGRRTTTRTSRSTRQDFAADGWQVTFGYQADGKAQALMIGLKLSPAFEQPLADGEKLQAELVLRGAGRFTPEFFAALDEVCVSYTPAALEGGKPGTLAVPAACAARISGDELRKRMAAAGP